MKTSFNVQFFCLILLGLIFISLSLEAWNFEVDRLDTRLRNSFFGARISKRIENEVLQALGEPQDGSRWLSISFKEMGIQIIPSEGHALDQWADALAETALLRVHRILCRLNTFLLLFPLNGLVIFCFVGDGLLGRRIKQLRFDYPSPLIHRLTLHGFLGLMVISLLLILAPIPFAPQEILGLTTLCSWLLEAHLLHLPKRL